MPQAALYIGERALCGGDWPTLPAPTPAPSPTHEPEPTPEQRAALVRVEAQKACAAGEWTACEAKLDEAAKIDPAGESSPAVQQMRESLPQWQRRENDLEAKPRK
jgi:hypothetical protein